MYVPRKTKAIRLPSSTWFDCREDTEAVDELLERGMRVIVYDDFPRWRNARDHSLAVSFVRDNGDAAIVLKDERDLDNLLPWIEANYEELVSTKVIRPAIG